MAYQGKKLVNDPNDVVTEFIEGLVETYPGLQYLDGFPLIKVVLRADVSSRMYDKVAVISDIELVLWPSSSVVVLSGYLDNQLDNLSQHRPGDALLRPVEPWDSHVTRQPICAKMATACK